MKELLKKLDACTEAQEWAEGKEWIEIFETCHRGDWLLWLFKKTNPDDLRLLTLAKGHCASTVLHLMKDDRSLKSVQVAIDFGNGIATIEELAAAAYSAAAAATSYASYAAYAAAADSADYASYASYAAAYADASYASYSAYSSASAAYAAASYAAAAYSADSEDARIENQKLTADIVRLYIPIELWNV